MQISKSKRARPRFAVPNGMGNDLFVDAAESASFPLPGTGKREGGEKTQPLHRFSSHLGMSKVG